MLLRASVCRLAWARVDSFLLGVCLGKKLLDQMAVLFNLLRSRQIAFEAAAPFSVLGGVHFVPAAPCLSSACHRLTEAFVVVRSGASRGF